MSAFSSIDPREPLDVDSTQTLRAITPSELYDSQQPKWHAIQLVASDKPINLDMMPRLEAFAAHRLYTVAGKQGGGTQYALRLGFFADEQSAEVICGYLRTFFSSPEIVRVSAAEQARFAQPAAPRAAAQKPASVPAAAPVAGVAVTRQALAQPPSSPIKTKGAQTSPKRPKTLAEELLEEARGVKLARTGRNPAAAQSGSWLTRLFSTNGQRRPASRR